MYNDRTFFKSYNKDMPAILARGLGTWLPALLVYVTKYSGSSVTL